MLQIKFSHQHTVKISDAQKCCRDRCGVLTTTITITALVELSVNLNIFCVSAFLISKVTSSIVDIALFCHFMCLNAALQNCSSELFFYPIFVSMFVQQDTTKIQTNPGCTHLRLNGRNIVPCGPTCTFFLNDLVRAPSTFGNLSTWGYFFQTINISGARSGMSGPGGFINHHRAPCGESKTKKHKPLSTIFVLPLDTHQDTSVSPFDVSLIH